MRLGLLWGQGVVRWGGLMGLIQILRSFRIGDGPGAAQFLGAGAFMKTNTEVRVASGLAVTQAQRQAGAMTLETSQCSQIVCMLLLLSVESDTLISESTRWIRSPPLLELTLGQTTPSTGIWMRGKTDSMLLEQRDLCRKIIFPQVPQSRSEQMVV